MRNLIKYFRQNVKRVLIIIGVIAFAFICLKVINEIVKQARINRQNELTNQNYTRVEDTHNPTQSALSGTTLSENAAEENSNLIKQFVNYCINKNTKEAYNMLSTSCKEQLYSNLEMFEQNYRDYIFNTKNNYNLSLLVDKNEGVTYQITYTAGNPLQTGTNSSSNNFVDYITIVNEKAEKKLNINSFVNQEELNKTSENQGIQITVQSKIVYMNYEIYTINVTNKTQKEIVLNNGNSKDIYLYDTSNNKYESLIYEIPTSSLSLPEGRSATLNIKFNKLYGTSTVIQGIQFDNIYLDKSETQKNENSQEEAKKVSIQIEL